MLTNLVLDEIHGEVGCRFHRGGKFESVGLVRGPAFKENTIERQLSVSFHDCSRFSTFWGTCVGRDSQSLTMSFELSTVVRRVIEVKFVFFVAWPPSIVSFVNDSINSSVVAGGFAGCK